MKTLPSLAAFLLCDGAKTTGSFTEGYEYNWENFYIHEVEEIKEFAEWIDKEVGGASIHNIYWLFRAYKHPNNEKLKAKVLELKTTIKDINDRMNKYKKQTS